MLGILIALTEEIFEFRFCGQAGTKHTNVLDGYYHHPYL